ncbi:MAG: chromate transporter, partial [bacterium]
FLQRMGERTGWFEQELISDMVAISESTPGPIGVNMATYVGYNIAGIFGGIVASLAEVLPSIIIVTIFAQSLKTLTQNKYYNNAFYGMRPAVTGLIAYAGLSVIEMAILNTNLYSMTGEVIDLIDVKKLVYFAIVFIAIKKYKKHPVFYIGVSAIIGIALGF